MSKNFWTRERHISDIPALLSAHRCGAGERRDLENTWAALDAALTAGVEYIEFDVQRLGDGTLVLFHDTHIRSSLGTRALADMDYFDFAVLAQNHLTYDAVLEALATAGMKAHIDFKFWSADGSHEVEATQRAVQVLGDNIIVTTNEDVSVRAVRAWSRTNAPDLLVGLSLGRHRISRNPLRALQVRLTELFPHRRVTWTSTNLIVAHHVLARATLARYARRHHLPLLVWTVDRPSALAYWTRPGRAWLVTSNFPARAIALRSITPITGPAAGLTEGLTTATSAVSNG